MTRSPSHLQVIPSAGSPEPVLASVVGAGLDDGRLTHPATRGRATMIPSSFIAEGRVLGFVAELLEAPDDVAGRVLTGVDDAALAVLRAARDARPGLRHASVVLPHSAHPAYFTAVASLGLVPVVVAPDADGRAPLGAMARAIRDDTVLVVASAPSYTHGTVDPIGWIAAACAAREVPLHVDATCGGWALAYAARSGQVGPSWGFAVDGVTSVALDVGPECGGPADLVAVLHRTAAGARALTAATLARGPLTLPASWTRPSALLADVVETLEEIGHEGCASRAADALSATAAVVAGLVDLRGVLLGARPESTVVTLRADLSCDVFTLADALHQRGWTSHPVLPEVGPPLLRLPVTAAVLPVVDRLLDAIADAVAEARARGRAEVDATLRRMLEQLDPDAVSEYAAHLLLDAAATLDAADPADPADPAGPADSAEGHGRRAATNLLLAAAGPGVRQALLSVHLDRLAQPQR